MTMTDTIQVNFQDYQGDPQLQVQDGKYLVRVDRAVRLVGPSGVERLKVFFQIIEEGPYRNRELTKRFRNTSDGHWELRQFLLATGIGFQSSQPFDLRPSAVIDSIFLVEIENIQIEHETETYVIGFIPIIARRSLDRLYRREVV